MVFHAVNSILRIKDWANCLKILFEFIIIFDWKNNVPEISNIFSGRLAYFYP